MSAKKIMLLGLPRSGKTNYVSSVIAYMGRYGCNGWRVQEGNGTVDERIDELQDALRDGIWLPKTDKDGGPDEYRFQKPGFLWGSDEVIIKDWPGEAFADIVAGGSNGDFEKDCKEAQGFMLFLDGEYLEYEEKEVRKCLRELKERMFASAIGRRSFALVVTKSDYLFPEFSLNNHYVTNEEHFECVEKKRQGIRESYGAFFNMAETRRYSNEIFFVSLVPEKKFFVDKTERGRIPRSNWSLKRVMETQYDSENKYEGKVYGPLWWILQHV